MVSPPVRTILRVTLFVLSALLAEVPIGSAQTPYLYHPEPIEPGSMVTALGASITFLPRILVEGEFRQAPLLDIRARYGLPVQFSLEGGVRTNVFTNFVDLRARYALKMDPLFIGPSLRLGWWYGFAPFDGFDIRATGWLYYPGIDFGLRYDSVRFAGTLEAQVITSLDIETDGIATEQTRNKVAGYSLHLTLEQPFWGETSTVFGLRISYSKSLYQAWLAFSSFDEYLFYPEFTFGVHF